MWSHSRVSCFKQCPMKYELKYLAEIKTLPKFEADDPLVLGTAMHEGIEKDADTAINDYLMSYPVIGDLHENEAIKLRYWVPKAKEKLPEGLDFEVKVEYKDFIGYIDGLEKKDDGTYAIWDFKYANPKNTARYEQSWQLHLYKHYFEKMTGEKVSELHYLIIPKTAIRQKKSEDLYQFRKRLDNTLESMEIQILDIEYDDSVVAEYQNSIEEIEMTRDFEKNESRLCDWCEYQCICENKEEQKYMIELPSSSRREVGAPKKRKIWIYGDSFSGKTTMLDKAPNPLNLNTDGNIEFVTMPYIAIKDIVTVEGRITKRKFAWEVLKEAIDELEKNQNDFKTIIIDLLEDTREMCRLYEYDRMNIEHESDSNYGKGWDIVKTEYLSQIRRFFNLDYENLVVVSHSVVSEITKKSGQKITKIAPNIQEALANKIAGMVDIVARVVVDEDGTRTLNFKSNEFIFGGGRLKDLKTTSVPLDWDELMKVYDTAEETQETEETKETPKTEETPKRRKRRARE